MRRSRVSHEACPILTRSQTFAAIVALLNDYRISEGKAPLGFLNPFLYGAGVAGLTDITSGFNPGCGTLGFAARAGWDPVSILFKQWLRRSR